jgi:hypothetical protein
MISHRLKILASILIAFILVEGYVYLSQNPTVVPTQAQNFKEMLSNLKFNPASLTRLFTLQFSDDKNLAQINNGSTSMNGINNGPPPVYVPPTKTIKPTDLINQIPKSAQPTPDDGLVDFPFEPGDINNLGGVPTNPPKPTKAPKPTKVPALPPITSDLRPGTTLYGIFDEVSKRACFPTALLKAIQYKETGAHIKNDLSSSTIKIYNTYGWWKTGTGEPCFGMGYYAQSGTIPPDSVGAGGSCGPAYGDPTDLKIMGITSISEWEQGVAQKYITSIIPVNDRRVFFDNALMFAFISRSRVGDPPKDCNDWPDDVVMLVAEKHSGTCDYYYSINGASGNYCKEILDLYKQYKKEGN